MLGMATRSVAGVWRGRRCVIAEVSCGVPNWPKLHALFTMCDLWPIRWHMSAGGFEEESTMDRKAERGP